MRNVPKSSQQREQEHGAPLLSEFEVPHEDGEDDLKKAAEAKATKRHLFLVGFTILVFVEVGWSLQRSPVLQLYEDNVKRQLERRGHGREPGFEDLVQKELVLVRSTQSLLETFPSIFLTIPYGIVAQKYGAKFVLVLSMSGIILGILWSQIVCWFEDTLDLRAVWFSCLFFLIGGGWSVNSSMMYTLVSQYSSKDERASTMSILSAFILGTDVIALPLASLLLRTSPWLPIVIGDISFVLGLMSIRLLGDPPQRSEPILSIQDENELGFLSSSQSSTEEPKTTKQIWWKTVVEVCQNRTVFFLLVPIFCNSLVSGVPEFLVICVEKRLRWSISQGNLLTALASLVTLSLFGLILPGTLSIFKKRFSFSLQKSDLTIALTSCTFLITGATLLGSPASPFSVIAGIAIYALGAALPVVLNNTISRAIGQENLSMVYSITGMVGTVGTMLSAPLLAGIYRIGLDSGGVWLGLPFVVVVVAYSLSGVATFVALR